MQFEVDTLKVKKLYKNRHFVQKNSKFKGVYSDNLCARVVNLVTYDVVDYQKIYLKFKVIT
jgi:hypothetical protein